MEILSEYSPQLLKAFATTIQLTVLSALGALIFGTLLAAMRVSPVWALRTLATGYVNIVRNTPLTLVVLFASFGLAQQLGITLVDPKSTTSITDSSFRLAVLSFVLYTATFVCEALRAGVNTIPVGQSEAGRSLGLSFTQGLTHVILPQAFRSVVGPLGSVLIALTKNTTVASVIGVAEASLLMKEVIENTSALIIVGLIFALGFMILTIPTGAVFGYLSKKLEIRR
ncbi:amino acid ABC transporter permease [Pseudarthrobacter sp. MM222]|uniref:amino acid ABC transporter permease n=1 Tax=Pseudarthrobacter sp. MM222 TaxID=3018929 RepID=UPI0022DDC349|nr:amino acid ABC transporter permease [Pseudarthrobacter sp. MM222]CAI3794314.1 putative glutamine ABC transporter permease protein GlnM [Pseudarthrobacter sp. MM222]